MNPNGSPGTPEMFVSFENDNPLSGGVDGLAVDAIGNLYVAQTLDQKLLKLVPMGVPLLMWKLPMGRWSILRVWYSERPGATTDLFL